MTPERKRRVLASCSALIVLSVSLLLSACMNVRKHYQPMWGADKVAKMEILYCDTADDVWADGELLMEGDEYLVSEVDPAQYETVMEGLADLPFTESIILLPVAVDPNFYYDDAWVLRVTYDDGSVELISAASVQDQMAESGKGKCTHYFLDAAEWESFLDAAAPGVLEETP